MLLAEKKKIMLTKERGSDLSKSSFKSSRYK